MTIEQIQEQINSNNNKIEEMRKHIESCWNEISGLENLNSILESKKYTIESKEFPIYKGDFYYCNEEKYCNYYGIKERILTIDKICNETMLDIRIFTIKDYDMDDVVYVNQEKISLFDLFKTINENGYIKIDKEQAHKKLDKFFKI